MGMFDGASGRGELASTAHVAKLLHAPVLLVVDASAMARSAAAIVHGYSTFDPDVKVAGVIFNRVGSDHHEQLLREAIADLSRILPVLGALRRDERIVDPRAPPRPRPRRRARGRSAPGARRARRRGQSLRRSRRRRSDSPATPHSCPARAGAPSPTMPRAPWRRPSLRQAQEPGRPRRCASRLRPAPRSRSTTRRTWSCFAAPAPSSSRSTRCTTTRCRLTPARCCSPAASPRCTAPSWRPTRRCARRSPRSLPPGAPCSRSAAGCCTCARSWTATRCAACCPHART